MTTTLIADDEPDMLLMLRLTFRLSDGLEIVAEATDGAEAVARYTELGGNPIPEVVVLDNRMPAMTGLDAAEAILAVHPEQKIVLYSAQLDEATRAKAAELGIRACVHKQDLNQIPDIIRSFA